MAKTISILVLLSLAGPAFGQAAIHQGDANYNLAFFIGDGNGLPMTGKTVVPFLSKNGGAWAAASGACAEVGKGIYKTAGNATDTNTLGVLLIDGNYPGSFTTERTYWIIRADLQNDTNLNLSRLTATALETSVKGGEANSVAVILTRLATSGYTSPTGAAVNVTQWGGAGLPTIGTSTLTAADLHAAFDSNLGQMAARLWSMGLPLTGVAEANVLAGVMTRGTSTLATSDLHWLDGNLSFLAAKALTGAVTGERDANFAAIYVKAAAGSGGTGSSFDANYYGTIAALSPSTGTGANAVVVWVLDANGGSVIQGAAVRATLNTDTVLLTTRTDGNVRFTIGNGSWTIGASAWGFDGNQIVKDVAAAGTQIIRLNALSAPAASNPGMCACSITVYGGDGQPLAGKILTAILKTVPAGSGSGFVGTPISATSDVNGGLTLTLWRRGVYEVFSDGVKVGGDVTVSNAASMQLPSVKVKP